MQPILISKEKSINGFKYTFECNKCHKHFTARKSHNPKYCSTKCANSDRKYTRMSQDHYDFKRVYGKNPNDLELKQWLDWKKERSNCVYLDIIV